MNGGMGFVEPTFTSLGTTLQQPPPGSPHPEDLVMASTSRIRRPHVEAARAFPVACCKDPEEKHGQNHGHRETCPGKT